MSDRAATLARLAALERFREERSRQQLAAAHAEAQAAREARQRDEATLETFERARASALHHPAADMARYALYADAAMAAETVLARSIDAMAQSESALRQASEDWSLARARRDMAGERAAEAREQADQAVAAKAAADLMDLWLGREAAT
jgi:hypothetical protein